MIFDFIISVALSIVAIITSIFPTYTGMPAGWDTAVTTFSGYIGIFAPIVPIAAMIDIISLIFVYEVTIFLFKAGVWFYQRIPILGK